MFNVYIYIEREIVSERDRERERESERDREIVRDFHRSFSCFF